MPDIWVIVGGLMIGVSASALLYLNGKIAGISGLLWSSMTAAKSSLWFALPFIIGLPLGAYLFHTLSGQAIPTNGGSWLSAIGGGLLVGFGVKLGSGCTSGHGVCGIGRFSLRSLVATLCFMFSGITTVFILRHVL